MSHRPQTIPCWIAVLDARAAGALRRAELRRLALLADGTPRPVPGDRVVVVEARGPRYATDSVYLATLDVLSDEGDALVTRHRVAAPAGHEVGIAAVRVDGTVGWTHDLVRDLRGQILRTSARDHARIEMALLQRALAHGPAPKRPRHRRPRTPGRRALSEGLAAAGRIGARIGAVLLVGTLLASCGTGSVAPASTSPSATATPLTMLVFYGRPDQPPVGVSVPLTNAPAIADRLRARFDALAAAPLLGPSGSVNLARTATARLARVGVRDDLATLDYEVADETWGLRDAKEVLMFVHQVVFTATDERSIYKVQLTQNGGEPAVIAVDDVIVTYTGPLTRETVSPDARQDHTVAYFARDQRPPVAVYLEGAGTGATPEERIRSRLVALETGPATLPLDAGPGTAIASFNVVPSMKARLAAIAIRGSLVTIDYSAPDGDWGLNGSAMLRALVEQLVFTATEEPGIDRVLITQNAGQLAIIGGEGLVVDGPQTRQGVATRR